MVSPLPPFFITRAEQLSTPSLVSNEMYIKTMVGEELKIEIRQKLKNNEETQWNAVYSFFSTGITNNTLMI